MTAGQTAENPTMGPRAKLALDTIMGRPTIGIPSKPLHVMEWRMIDRLAGCPEGTYRREPRKTYRQMLEKIGTCLVDQWIPENPLSMGSAGYGTQKERGATTGAESIERDGIVIDSPEAAITHLERFVFPDLRQKIASFDEESRYREILDREKSAREEIGPGILKSGYGFTSFPRFRYGTYGYQAYFMAFALYPEIMERDFSLQADLALLNNRAVARAYREECLPPLYRLDHDMADSRGTLVNVKWLDKLWFPHFTRCLEPVLAAGVKLLWHCDGNLMEMVPRLLEAGLAGFQGFQYEDGMDYEKICRMKTREGEDLTIMAGVSVTRTLPWGTPDDIRREMAWLVRHGPPGRLILGASSSITPGVPWKNLATMVEGLNHYREKGRKGI